MSPESKTINRYARRAYVHKTSWMQCLINTLYNECFFFNTMCPTTRPMWLECAYIMRAVHRLFEAPKYKWYEVHRNLRKIIWCGMSNQIIVHIAVVSPLVRLHPYLSRWHYKAYRYIFLLLLMLDYDIVALECVLCIRLNEFLSQTQAKMWLMITAFETDAGCG